MKKKHKPKKKIVIVIEVSGGVAYPPDELPEGIEVKIIDHDNEGR